MLSFLLFVVFVLSMILLVRRAVAKDGPDLVSVIYMGVALASGIWWAMRTWPIDLLLR